MRSVEEQIIQTICRAFNDDQRSGIRVGIGDDTAVYKAPDSEDLLLTTDQLIEGTHFVKDIHPAYALGYKTVSRAVSDIAAMGGKPLCFLLSLSLPNWSQGAWLGRYVRGISRVAEKISTPLVGGDVAYGERFSAVATIIGSVPPSMALTRSGAHPGDLIYVSGRLGGSALGLKLLNSGCSPRISAARRHLYPEPRLALGRFLRTKIRASAVIDLSDGLSIDITKLANASSVAADIDLHSIPRFRGASVDEMIFGGEEYELLFTVRPEVRVPTILQGLTLTKIGRIKKGSKITLKSNDGQYVMRPHGFEHFQA